MDKNQPTQLESFKTKRQCLDNQIDVLHGCFFDTETLDTSPFRNFEGQKFNEFGMA